MSSDKQLGPFLATRATCDDIGGATGNLNNNSPKKKRRGLKRKATSAAFKTVFLALRQKGGLKLLRWNCDVMLQISFCE